MKTCHQKILAHQISKQRLWAMKETAIKDLEGVGFLYTKFEVRLRSSFLPWLVQKSCDEMNQNEKKLKKGVETFLKEIQEKLTQAHRNSFLRRKEDLIEKEKRKNDEIQRKIEEKQRIHELAVLHKHFSEMKAQFFQFQQIIKETSISSPNFLELQFDDIYGEEPPKPFVGIFGGFLGNLWLTFDILNEEYKALLKKMEIEDFLIFSDKKFAKLVTQFLSEKLIAPLNLPINLKYKDKMEILLGAISKESDESPKISKDLILLELLSQEDLLYTNFSNFQALRESHKLNEKAYRCLIKGILELLSQNKDSVYEDKERKIARSKINIVYGSNDPEERVKINAVFNFKVPLVNEIQMDNQAFMSIGFYDGEEFSKRKQNSPEIDHQNLNVFAFAPNQEKLKGTFLVNDEKAAIVLRKTMHDYIKKATKEYSKLKYEDFLIDSRKKLDAIQKEFLKKLCLNPLETPVFDFEL